MTLAITLSDNAITVILPSDLQWTDEYGWTPVEHSTDYSLDGALVIQEALRQDGRPITLYGGTEGAWATRQQLNVLYALASQPAQTLTLDLWDRRFNVMFRRPAIEAAEIIRLANPANDHYYAITLNFVEVNV